MEFIDDGDIRNADGFPVASERATERRYALSKSDQLSLQRRNSVRFHGAMRPATKRAARRREPSLLLRLWWWLTGPTP